MRREEKFRIYGYNDNNFLVHANDMKSTLVKFFFLGDLVITLM